MFGWFKNPLDTLLSRGKREKKTRVLVLWNRGLGDIPLGLYAFVLRVRRYFPQAPICFLTRADLVSAFAMLPNVEAIPVREMERGVPFAIEDASLDIRDTDLVFESLPLTRWLKWQVGRVVPRLKWNPAWETKWNLPMGAVGIHLDTETGRFYQYEKNWPKHYWQTLIKNIERPVFLFGHHSDATEWPSHVIDLRGKTTVPQLLDLIQKHCDILIAPDSGILSLIYYLDVTFPLSVISLWADPKQGILRQKVLSPNPLLEHFPLIAKNADLSTVTPDQVEAYIH